MLAVINALNDIYGLKIEYEFELLVEATYDQMERSWPAERLEMTIS